MKSFTVREEEAIRSDLSGYLKRHEQKEMLRFLTAGSVDDGKSTLIGRLLYDSHLIYQDHLNSIRHDSQTYQRMGNDIDLSLLTDGLKAEREQGITIDVAYRYFSTEKRSFIICDAPGHEQYTRNMATGASHCDLALILIDAVQGVKDQTRRHSLIATLMGIRQIAVLVNKMDLTGYSEKTFRDVCGQYRAFASKLEIGSLTFIPVSALKGDNVVERSENMPWYRGAPLLSYLEDVPLLKNRNLTDFRFPVQLVIRADNGLRGYAGSIVSGIVRVGDEVTVLPSGIQTRIKTIETYDGRLNEAFAPMPVVLTVAGEVDISRGEMLAKINNVPRQTNRFEAMLVWMDDTQSLKQGNDCLLCCGTQTVPAKAGAIRYKFNPDRLTREDAAHLALNDIGRVEMIAAHALLFDAFSRNRKTGSFILIDRNSNRTCAAGMILEQEVAISAAKPDLQTVNPVTVWLTGLSGSGKTTVAHALKKRFDEAGIRSVILDGDELRRGLNNNLGFTPDDRKENVRRTAEVARLFNMAGSVSIVALISPYKADRAMAAGIIGENFMEVWVDADIETCRIRDPKGLYQKIRQGEITGFTGIDAPYEIPENPDLIIRTATVTVNDSVNNILNHLKTIK